MHLTVLTANLPRHYTLINRLVDAGHDVHAVIEPKSLSYRGQSGILRRYWARVDGAELQVFGQPRLQTDRVTVVPRGELTKGCIDWAWTDQVIVFSSSFIKGPLMDALEAIGALNIHAGIAPEYRGSAPNMWAHYDGRDDLIGCQVQRLSRKLDGGEILAEVRPVTLGDDYFVVSMRIVSLGLWACVRLLARPTPWHPIRPNDDRQKIRYAVHEEFTEEVANQILMRSDSVRHWRDMKVVSIDGQPAA